VSERSAQPARRRSGRARSQHFLRSPRLAAAIVADASVRPGELVLDLGAGSGRLVQPLAAAGAHVRAVELDPLWAAKLRERFRAAPNVEVVEDDILRVPLPARPFRVVANLPFHLTTAMLHRLLDDPGTPLRRADVLVEWEVARKRGLCWPSTMLNVVWGARYELDVVRRVPAACFEPHPDADAGLLRIVRRSEPLVSDRDAASFRALVEVGFRGRGRSLRAALAARVRGPIFKQAGRELGFDSSVAARDLDVHQWAGLFHAVGAVRGAR
jgi:23S rRNA (adenine-N6)-dimethyltransferase